MRSIGFCYFAFPQIQKPRWLRGNTQGFNMVGAESGERCWVSGCPLSKPPPCSVALFLPSRCSPCTPTPGSVWCISMTARWGGKVNPPSVVNEVLGLQWFSSSPLQPASVLRPQLCPHQYQGWLPVLWLVVGCPYSLSPRFSLIQHLTQCRTRSGTSIKGFCRKNLHCCYWYIPPTSQEFFQ